MKNVTNNLIKLIKNRKNKKIIYQQSKIMNGNSFVG